MGNVTSFAGNGLTSKLNRPWFCLQWTAACAGIYNSHSEVFGAARDSAALRLRRKVNNWKGLGPSPGQDFSQRYAPYACRTDNFLNPSAKNASALFAKAMALPRAIKTAFTLESRRQICNMQAQGPCGVAVNLSCKCRPALLYRAIAPSHFRHSILTFHFTLSRPS